MQMLIKYKSGFIIFFLGLLFSIPLILPYFHAGYFPTHDGEWAVVRLGDMYRELKDLQFPARYSGNLNFGYGYPLFEFAYPLPYYIGFLLHLFHMSFMTTIKLLFAASVPLSFFAMYLLTKKVWKSQLAGMLCSILYIYYPYRLVDLYVRGSIGESLSFVLFPLILFFILTLSEQKKVISAICLGLTTAALIMMHNIMTVEFLLIAAVAGIVCVLDEKTLKKRLVLQFFCAGIIATGISCFFWLPALSEEKLIALSVTPIANRSLYFVKPLQFLLPSWGYGSTGFSYQLGIPQLLILVLFVGSFIFFYKKKSDRLLHNLLVSFTGIIALYIFLLFSPSLLLWKILPLFKEINYPWTLLAPIGFLLTFLSGYLVKQKSIKWIFCAIVSFSVLYNLQYAHPSSYVNNPDQYYLTNDATTTSSDEYMPVWVTQKPLQRPVKSIAVVKGNVNVISEQSTSKKKTIQITASVPSVIQLNTIYYPGWKVFIDNMPVALQYDNPKGLIEIKIPSGTHLLSARFTETTTRLLADSVSVLTLLFIAFLFVPKIQKKLYVEK